MVNSSLILKLQKAHAAHIEAIYSRLADQPGNPAGIEIHAGRHHLDRARVILTRLVYRN